MIRKEAISIVANKIANSPIISANGFISRDLFESYDKPSNFYMIGSMGLASSIGVGVALKNTKKKIYVFDGDGNILMNLGSFVTIGFLKPKNLVHIIFDNSIHESTGGQPAHSSNLNIGKIAKSTNYTVFTTNTKNGLEKILLKIKNTSGPIIIIVKIEKEKCVSKRISLNTLKIRSRFMDSLKF